MIWQSDFKKQQLYLFALFMVLYEFTTYAANDMIMPGMIGVIKEFNAPLSYVALSLVLYILGNTLLTPFIGPLADKYGKRKVILTGNFIFVITSGAMLFTQSIHQFLVVRIFEGMGLAVIAVGYTLIHENFNDKDAVKLTALMGNVAILAPLLGPIIGAAIVSYLNWRFVFILVVVLSTATLIALFYCIPKYEQHRETEISISVITNMYLNVVKSRDFQFGVIIVSIAFLPSLAWIGLAPTMLLYKMKLNYFSYIVYQLITIGGMSISSITMQFISGRMKFVRILHIGISLIGISIILSAIAVLMLDHLDFVSWALFIYGFGASMCNGIILRIILSSKEYSANYAMSVMIFVQTLLMMLGLCIFNRIVTHFDYSLDCFSAVNVLIGTASLVLMIMFAKRNRNRAWQ